MRPTLKRYLPIFDWGRDYSRSVLVNDGLAAIIVTIMLIPQSLAYAMLAGLPPQMGLYASILPLIAYALLGTSRTLAVGPVAVISLMTAAAASALAPTGSDDYAMVAITLAFISGVVLCAAGLFRLGFLANFLSHPVISGFISASGLLIAASQLKHILGVETSGHNLLTLGLSLLENLQNLSWETVLVGSGSIVFLAWSRSGLKPLLAKLGLEERPATLISRAGPVLAVAFTIFLAWKFQLDQNGVKIIGDIPHGLPVLSAPSWDVALWLKVIAAATLISIIGFVESVSVAQTFAAKRRQKIEPDQELIALGAANFAASFSGGYPVTGGFARSAVNFDAGAETPAAGAFTAAGIALATVTITPVLTFLPQATLAATIIVAVLSLVNVKAIRQAWYYSKTDAAAMLATILVTLFVGVEAGVLSGMALSIFLFLYRTSHPHYAEVGLVQGTEYFRNTKRQIVIVSDTVKTLRVDESLYFANARFLEDRVYEMAAKYPAMKHFVLMCPAVNEIDGSALESLEAINLRLKDAGITFHLSEVKGPVLDRLKRSHLLVELTGEIHATQYSAFKALHQDLDDPAALI